MTEVLRLLHEYAVGDRQIREIKNNNETYISFGEVSYLKDTLTNLLVYGKTNEFYSIETLLLLWEKRAMPHPSYVKEAGGRNIRAVTRPDRRDILEYLEGKRSTIPPNHDPSQPPPPYVPTNRLVSDATEMEPERKKAKLDSAVKGQRINLLSKEREPGDPSQLRSLSENLTADVLAALKKKRMNNQKKNIINLNDGDVEMGAGRDDREERDIKKTERIWKTRANCMEAQTKNFSGLLDVLKGLKARDEAQARQKAVGGPTAATTAPPVKTVAPAANKQRSLPGYSRYDQEIFTKEQNAEFSIDPEMTFVGSNLSALKRGEANAQRKQTAPSVPSSSGNAYYSSRVHSSTVPDHPRKRTSKTPIIIIPAAGTSLITMYNVREMLQDMKFVTSDEKKLTSKRENEVLLHRKKGDVTVPYRVVDNPLKLTDEEWERVIAVFVMGPQWQFKGWKFGGNPVDIFANIAAFHVYYDDMKLDANVAKWNVTRIPISKEKRHLDRARLVTFWDVVDKHMIKNKPHLRH